MHKLISVFSILFFGFILWVIYLANTAQKSIFFDLVASIAYGDKLGHFCLFGFLTLGANFAFKLRYLAFSSLHVYVGSMTVFIFVILEELSQHFVTSRTLDATDLLADFVGIIVFSLLTKVMVHNKDDATNTVV